LAARRSNRCEWSRQARTWKRSKRVGPCAHVAGRSEQAQPGRQLTKWLPPRVGRRHATWFQLTMVGVFRRDIDHLRINSLVTRALIREILWLHSPFKCPISRYLSQRIATTQANLRGARRTTYANIWPGKSTIQTNVYPDSAGLNGTHHAARKNARPDSTSTVPRGGRLFLRPATDLYSNTSVTFSRR